MKIINFNQDERLAIASLAPCILFNICNYDNKETALKEAYKTKQKLILKCNTDILKGINIYSNKIYKNMLELSDPEIINLYEFKKLYQQYFINNFELKEITKKQYEENIDSSMLMNIHKIDNCFLFTFIEPLSETLARQYCEKDGKYYTKIVDMTDKLTWINNNIL